ncbi:MAG TPA: hypothetical protein DD733_03385, partial [Clostridiales bacterium]|nr:hypothetical protein [Clostridiales bacterium]
QHNCFCGSQQCFPQCCYPKPHCKCPPGPRGPRGPRGLRGPKGEGSDGAIIPFASGNTLVALTTVVNESNALTTGYVAAIGFGETQNGNTFGVGGELALAAGNMAFSVPRNIRITDITAFFTNTAQLTLGASAIQISAQLFYSPATDIAFLPLPGTRVNLTPVLTGVVPANSVFTGSLKDLKVSVLSGTKLVLVFFARLVSGPSIAVTITGNAGAGVNIA